MTSRQLFCIDDHIQNGTTDCPPTNMHAAETAMGIGTFILDPASGGLSVGDDLPPEAPSMEKLEERTTTPSDTTKVTKTTGIISRKVQKLPIRSRWSFWSAHATAATFTASDGARSHPGSLADIEHIKRVSDELAKIYSSIKGRCVFWSTSMWFRI